MKDKISIFSVGFLLGVILTATVLYIYPINKIANQPMRQEMHGEPPQMPMEKETTAQNIDTGKIITENHINLNEYDSNITITKQGIYTLTGEFENSVFINADGKVTLNLENIVIRNNVTAAIANISTNELVIELSENTDSLLSDGGSSEYDACIYSLGALTITGNGNLNVFGNQEEGEGIATQTNDLTIDGGNITIESNDDGINAGGDGGTITINGGEIFIQAKGDGIDSNKNLIINGGNIYTIGSPAGGDSGIDTDEGFVIHGGTVIALGSDMLESPETSSKQKSACFTLKNKISQGTMISLRNENEEEMISFEAKEEFKTLILSDEKITAGTYTLYQNGEKTNFSVTVK